MAKAKSYRFNFPATKLNYINAVKPDTEFNPDGNYQVTLVYPLAVCRDLKEKVEKLDPRFAGLFNFKDNGDGTGQFKVQQKRVIRWKAADGPKEVIMKPTILNADNSKYDESQGDPWGGTIGEIGAVIETQLGAQRRGTILGLRLRGIRIHELVLGGDSDPLFGGGIQEGGDGEADDLPFDTDTTSSGFDDDEAPI